uniref:PCI domain-containing protein n=1 Tax=Acrobeloides nanus TaxID=290746 RepID=A0A914CJF7_9BILA
MVEKMEVDQETPKEKGDEKADEKKPEDIQAITYENLREWCAQLERGESHIVGRVLQALTKTRKELTSEILVKLVDSFVADKTQKDLLTSWLPAPPTTEKREESTTMDVDSKTKGVSGRSPVPTRRKPVSSIAQYPEVELYVHLLVLLYLVDQKQLEQAEVCAKNYISRIDVFDKRSLDPFLAKAFFYYALISERVGNTAELISYLNSRLRLSTLRNQHDTEAVLIISILRAYMILRNYNAAAKLVSKVTFPESAHNNDLARFLYYQGRIKALQLDYPGAARFFNQSLRKAPQDAAIGFKQNAQKWIVVLSLFQGEIPERSLFRMPIYRKTLAPYLELTHAVRLGDIRLFNSVLEKYNDIFKADETQTLIVRLRQNVIRTAIRQISLAYSRIYISDIAKKLQLVESEAAYMVTKAIKEGNIVATIAIDPKAKQPYMQSIETENVYKTTEPQFTFDSRIKNCLDLYNQAIKALRYPSDNRTGETIEEQRERELMELELAKDLEEDDDDF